MQEAEIDKYWLLTHSQPWHIRAKRSRETRVEERKKRKKDKFKETEKDKKIARETDRQTEFGSGHNSYVVPGCSVYFFFSKRFLLANASCRADFFHM